MNHIDAKGKACPMPVMMAKKEMDTGCEALSITVDNAIAVQNLSRLAESQGFAAETAEENGCYTITTYVNANEKVLTRRPRRCLRSC